MQIGQELKINDVRAYIKNECLKKGGRWVDGTCQMYDVVAEYQYKNPQPTQPQQPSETTLHAGQVQVGHDLIAGMVNAGVFDASGYGAAMNKWKQAEIGERDPNKNVQFYAYGFHTSKKIMSSNKKKFFI